VLYIQEVVMLDLTKDERRILEKISMRPVYRQANEFKVQLGPIKTSDIQGENINIVLYEPLDPDICKSLINKKLLNEVKEDEFGWVYEADKRLFAPKYEIE